MTMNTFGVTLQVCLLVFKHTWASICDVGDKQSNKGQENEGDRHSEAMMIIMIKHLTAVLKIPFEHFTTCWYTCRYA